MSLINKEGLVERIERYIIGCPIYSDKIKSFVKEILEAEIKHFPNIDPVKHSGINHIKSLYFSDGLYAINERSECSECKHDIDDFGQNFCSKCGAKLDGKHHFFRKKTIFVEGEDALVPISHTEYKRAEEWEYEIDRC